MAEDPTAGPDDDVDESPDAQPSAPDTDEPPAAGSDPGADTDPGTDAEADPAADPDTPEPDPDADAGDETVDPESASEAPEAAPEDGDAETDDAVVAGQPTSDGGETIPAYQSMPDVGSPGYGEQEGPAEDEEMPLAVHIEEMLKRLAIVIAVAGVVSIVVFPYAEGLINFLWNSILPQGPTTRPRLYGILELKLTELKVASLAGLIIALPVLVYQTYKFMRPGLYPHERRYYLAAVPTSLVLALIGVSFAYFLFLPLLFGYFLGYSREVADIGFALGKTFNLILLMMGYLAIVFQIPLFIMLAMMMGLVTREWLAERRLLFWGAFVGLAFFIGVGDPTGAAPFLVAVTMILLFEGTLLLAKWTDRGSRADWA